MRVAILSNVMKAEGEFKEVEENLMEFGTYIREVLESAGHEVIFFDVNESTYEALRNSNIDIAFNVCERFRGNSLFEPHIASMLELLDIPYTGSGHLTLATSINKVRVKEILMHYGILTPNYQVFNSKNKKLDPELKFPLIIKPMCMDNSIGITNDSVASNEDELRAKVGDILKTYDQPALVEEFVEGREITVSIIGNGKTTTALPLSEVVFKDWPENMKKVYNYEAKWCKDTINWKGIRVECPADLPKYQESRIKKIAVQVYKIMNCRDYGRIDIRLNNDGVPYVLEINPNPGISPNEDDGQPDFLPFAAKQAGITYRELIIRILNEALMRYEMQKLEMPENVLIVEESSIKNRAAELAKQRQIEPVEISVNNPDS